jgi:cell division inhibitor SepF
MAGAMRKMAVYLGLVEEDDRYDEYDDYDDVVDRREERSGREEHGTGPQRATVSALPERRTAGHSTPSPASARQVSAGDPYRITTLHPRTYNEARTIGENFREGTPVIMNLTEMDDTDAKRLVDFAAGLVFGLRGTIERVTQKVFLLSPADVDVTAEDKARIREGGFFNQS